MPRRVSTDCDVCNLPDSYNGAGDGIGSCDCPRGDCGAPDGSVFCTCPTEDDWLYREVPSDAH